MPTTIAGELPVRRIFVQKFGGGATIHIDHSVECVAIGNNSIMHAALVTPMGSERALLVDSSHPLVGHIEGPFYVQQAVAGFTDALELYLYETAPPPWLPVGRGIHRRAWKGGTVQPPDFSFQGIGKIVTTGRRRWAIGFTNGNVANAVLTVTGSVFDILTGAETTQVIYTSAAVGLGGSIIVDSESQSLACDFDVITATSDKTLGDANTVLVMKTED